MAVKEQDAVTSCSVGREYLLVLAGLSLGQSAASYALGGLAVAAITKDLGSLGGYSFAGLLRVFCCH